ncbi:hypothetical protein D1614_10310 [Maribellus luteus]|uniref:Uncharacterized protein n=1 Tax=Maribellus luteus TaxID=2305463 RepID=A0A399SY30_9BACT|nr:hypothetical protein D1614_10310 [Maribellus luteus]
MKFIFLLIGILLKHKNTKSNLPILLTGVRIANPHLRGIKSRTKAYQFLYDYFLWLVNLVKFFSPHSVVDTTQVGKAMINSALKGYPKNIIAPKDIIILAK